MTIRKGQGNEIERGERGRRQRKKKYFARISCSVEKLIPIIIQEKATLAGQHHSASE